LSLLNTTSYISLPTEFYQKIHPIPISNPYLVKFNEHLALSLGINPGITEQDNIIKLLAGNEVPSQIEPIAQAYAGHQFGHYVPLLGDGRAVLLGEKTDKEGHVWDIQLKGSGRTRYSRMGDGRAPLSAVLREYLLSAAMQGLGIPTTQSLAVIGSNETIMRQEGPVALGVLTRVASSYIRIGTFQYAAQLPNDNAVKMLADYTLKRHYPELLIKQEPYLELFKAVIDKQAQLIAEWMNVGFIHGVMNTDNMTISGETIDYGPCAFMDEYYETQVYSSIDWQGRYAYSNQVPVAYWNLHQFKETLLLISNDPLIHDEFQNALDYFGTAFNQFWSNKIRTKLGLQVIDELSKKIINRFFGLLQHHHPDFTHTFRLLGDSLTCEKAKQSWFSLFNHSADSQQWYADWRKLIAMQNSQTELNHIKAAMHLVNPTYIPRNHLVDQAIKNYLNAKDTSLMDRLLNVFQSPFTQIDDTEDLQRLPEEHERIRQTFCGT